MKNKKVILSTSKGLIVYKNSPSGWRYEKEAFLGLPVSLAYVNPHTGVWWACLAHRHWGQKLYRSFDEGTNWESIAAPVYPEGSCVKEGIPATLKYVWAFSHGGHNYPDEILVGTEPGGLFIGKNGGDEFSLVESLWSHPSRSTLWFGAGRDHPYIHSIEIDPRDSDHIYIAVSCAGIFETHDHGKSWMPKNKGLRAAFLPDPYPEVGYDPHMLKVCKTNPDVLWQQNHCGIFRSVDGASTWKEVTGEKGFPDFGYTIAIDHDNEKRAWVIPVISDEQRMAVDKKLCVCRTDDGGETWQDFRQGLPQENAFDIVLRHGLDVNENTLAFGTTLGNAFVSEDYGESWMNLSHHIPRVNAVLVNGN